MSNTFEPNLIDANDAENAEADVMITKIKMKKEAAITGVSDVSRAIMNHTFVGSGIKSEIIELEENMRQLLSEGKYGYKYVESVLLSLGYPLNIIRNVFEDLTGVSVEDWLDVDKTLWSVPPTIPGINYGWGEAKGSNWDFYFIMPFKCGHSIFGQKGDLHREEVHYFNTLDEARKQLQSLCKTCNYWDKPVDIKDLKEFPKQNLTDPMAFALTSSENEKFRAIDNYIYNNYDRIDSGTISRMLVKAKQNKEISANEYETLKQSYLFIEAADEPLAQGNEIKDIDDQGNKSALNEISQAVSKEEDKALATPLEDELKEETPSEFFENSVEEQKHDTVPADIVDKVLNYINYKNENLEEFTLTVQSFKYANVELSAELQKEMSVDRETKEVFFDANALVTVILKVKNNSLPEPENEKDALLIFSVVDGEVITADNLKAADEKLYALTTEGLSKLFS